MPDKIIEPWNLNTLIRFYAEKHGLDPAIVSGVVCSEISGNQFACRFEKDYQWLEVPGAHKPKTCSTETETMLQKTSIGLMQVMGGVYRQYGYKGWLSAIFSSPENQLDYGCRHLAAKIEKYGLSPGISAYNAGSPTNANQAYVDRVLKYAEEWIPF